jgi:hypothetical protein
VIRDSENSEKLWYQRATHNKQVLGNYGDIFAVTLTQLSKTGTSLLRGEREYGLVVPGV